MLAMIFVSLHAWGSMVQDEPTVEEARTRVIIADHFCPCQCGTHLPGSDRAPACFGCSVGKAEVTFIRESIAAGRPLREVLVALREPALVEVFADYDDPRLPEVWALAQAAAAAFAQHRVVLRSPGLDDDAMRAVEFAECARGTGRFSAWQRHLINHPGAWDRSRLLELARAEGLDGDALVDCLASIDVAAQVERDRSHARERGLQRFPAITVNRVPVSIDDGALRAALRRVTVGASI